MHIRTVPSSYVSAIIDAAASKGADRLSILADTGLTEELLQADKTRVPAKALQTITARILEILEDENLGFMNKRAKPGTFAMMCYACVGASNLRAALKRKIIYYDIVTDNFSLELHEDDEFAYFSLTPESGMDDPQHYMTLSLLIIALRTMSWFVDQRIPLSKATFSYSRPQHVSEYNFVFSCPIQFNKTENCLVFSKNYLDLPVTQNEESLKEFLQNAPMGLLASPKSENSLLTKVQSIIKHKVKEEFPEIDEVATQLNLTPATLRRRLKHEGSSYQQIKDDIRRDTAIYLLSRGTMSIEDIAEEIGFSEPTSFFRAFKRWTGVTPRSYLNDSQ